MDHPEARPVQRAHPAPLRVPVVRIPIIPLWGLWLTRMHSGCVPRKVPPAPFLPPCRREHRFPFWTLRIRNGFRSRQPMVLTGYMSAEYLTLRYSDDPETTLPSGNITLSNTSGTVAQGKTFYLKASGVSSVSWSSSNTTVATVENGFVEALSPGTAVITASYGSSSSSCTVTVTQSQGIRTAYTSRILPQSVRASA